MKVEDFSRYVTPEVPGCPDQTIERAVVFACDDFLRYSFAWQLISDPVTPESGVADYDMELVPGCLPLTISKVWTPNMVLRPITMDELSDILPNWQSATSTEPRFYNMSKGFGRLTVYPTPADPIATTLTFQAIYTIKNTSTSLPDEIVNHYLDTIAAGAKARLMSMPGVAWSNPQLSAMYQQQFTAGKSIARIDALHSKVPGSLRARPVEFGRNY